VGELLIVMILGLRYFSVILSSFLGAFSRPLSPLSLRLCGQSATRAARRSSGRALCWLYYFRN